eukprot:2413440-Rhodomonas_salina.1
MLEERTKKRSTGISNSAKRILGGRATYAPSLDDNNDRGALAEVRGSNLQGAVPAPPMTKKLSTLRNIYTEKQQAPTREDGRMMTTATKPSSAPLG